MIKKRSSIFYSTAFSRNDGPPLYYYNVLGKQLNWKQIIWYRRDISRYGKFDYHFWVDWGKMVCPQTRLGGFLNAKYNSVKYQIK